MLRNTNCKYRMMRKNGKPFMLTKMEEVVLNRLNWNQLQHVM